MSKVNQSWLVEGEYFESCNCEVLCPCLLSHMTARPTEGHCDVVVGFHVSRGRFANVDLAELNAAVAIYAPDKMADGNWTLAAYIDERGSNEQRAALESIFTGKAGGPMSALAALVRTVLPTKTVPITFKIDGGTRRLTIAGVSEVTVEGIVGAGQQVVHLDNAAHPIAQRLAIARSTTSRFNDQGLKFENSGRNGHFAPISWSSDRA
jgi:hypothetical protein